VNEACSLTQGSRTLALPGKSEGWGASRHCHHSTNPLDGGGARAVLGSQRGGNSEARGENRWTTKVRAWLLRARDGSRSGGSAEMHPEGCDSNAGA
jgi:hypothetical protein